MSLSVTAIYGSISLFMDENGKAALSDPFEQLENGN
jgi:hypothetical protein